MNLCMHWAGFIRSEAVASRRCVVFLELLLYVPLENGKKDFREYLP
jgi:hypothetical protein